MSDHAHRSGVRHRRGAAMFMALGALVIIAVLVAGSSYISMQESRLGQNALIQARAFAAAEYGLNKIQADWDKTPNLAMLVTDPPFDTAYALPGQEQCRVRYRRLNNETFWIVSEGRASAGNALSGNRQAVKRVGAVLRLRIPTIHTQGAITAGGNVTVTGGATVNGNDSIPPGWNTQCSGTVPNNKSGVVVPTGSTVSTTGNSGIVGGWRTDPLASDANTYVRYGDETWQTLTAQANRIYTGGTTIDGNIQPSVSLGYCNKGDPNNWGEPLRPPQPSSYVIIPECYNYFPIIYVNGDLTLQKNARGQGILLVNGSIRINGGFIWSGLIIVTNDIVRGNGNATVYGSVMARNEVKADESQVSGSTLYQYSTCALERAMRGSAQVVQAKHRAWAELF